MGRLTMRLFGGFEAQAGAGELLAVLTRKAQALLAYLALTPGQAHPRGKLAALLWSDASPAAARNALRQALNQPSMSPPIPVVETTPPVVANP